MDIIPLSWEYLKRLFHISGILSALAPLLSGKIREFPDENIKRLEIHGNMDVKKRSANMIDG